MRAYLAAPVLVQIALMALDEGWYHRRRGLPRWERIGHPLDTLSVALCYGWLVAVGPDRPHAAAVYAALALASCLFITKDEAVHLRRCGPGEQRLHACLFVLHPIVFAVFGLLWWRGLAPWAVRVQLGLTLGFLSYQIAYWSRPWTSPAAPRRIA